MENLGEVIHGHYGEYITQSYGGMSESEITKVLEHTSIGYNDNKNQIVVFNKEGRYIWGGLSAFSEMSPSSPQYQHIVYVNNRLQQAYEIMELINFPFLNAENCLLYLENPQSFNMENRKNEIVDNYEVEKSIQVKIDKKVLAKLAAYCVSKIRENHRRYLYILVPEGVEYQNYCQNVIEQLLGVVPAGLRKGFRIATNPSERDEDYFGVIFRSVKNLPSCIEKCVNLEEELGNQTLLVDYLPLHFEELLEASADSFMQDAKNSYLEKLYEREKEENGWPSDRFYIRYYEERMLWTKPLNTDTLQEFNKKLEEKGRDKNNIEEIVLERLNGFTEIEQSLKEDQRLNEAKHSKEMLLVFSDYKQLIDLLRKEKKGEFSKDFIFDIAGKINTANEGYNSFKEVKDEWEGYLGEKQLFDTLASTMGSEYCAQQVEKIIKGFKEDANSLYEETVNNFPELKEEFTKKLYTSIHEKMASDELEEPLVYWYYSKQQNLNQKESDQYAEYLQKKHLDEVRKMPTLEIVKETCAMFINAFETRKVSYIQALSEELLKCYARNERADETKELFLQEVNEIIGILKEYSEEGIKKSGLEKWYKEYLCEYLLSQIEKDIQTDYINRLFLILENDEVEYKEKKLVKVYEVIDAHLKEKKGEDKKDDSFEAFKSWLEPFEKALSKHIATKKVEIGQMRDQLIDQLDDYSLDCLLYYMNTEFNTETIKFLCQYVESVHHERLKAQFYDKGSEMILSHFASLKYGCEEMKAIYNDLTKYGEPSEELKIWYLDNWMSEEECNEQFKYMMSNMKTFDEYFYYCMNEKLLLNNIENSWDKMRARLKNMIKGRGSTFSAFISAIKFAEESSSQQTCIEKVDTRYDNYKEDFSFFYEENKIGVLLGRDRELTEIFSEAMSCLEFVKLCGFQNIRFMNMRGDIKGEFNEETVRESFIRLIKEQRGIKKGEHERKKSKEEKACMDMIMECCDLVKRKGKLQHKTRILWNKK